MKSRLIGGILLVSGTTVGAAMLALPVATGFAGFIPAQFLLILFWLYMTYTAFLILEVNLWMKDDANLISMAKRTLGFFGHLLAWVSYMFLLYSLTTAYLVGSGEIFANVVEDVFGVRVPGWFGPLPLLAVFSYAIYEGTKLVDYLNRVLMGVLVLIYVTMVIFLSPKVSGTLLMVNDWKMLLLGVSIMATSWGFHIIIPTLTSYLKRDVKDLKTVLLLGSLLPLAIYTLWQLVTLGIIPQSVLKQGYEQGENGATLLSNTLGVGWIAAASVGFAFIAIMTSFLGVSLSLWDCLSDTLKIRKAGYGRLLLYALTFVPPTAFALTTPRAFLSALEYAGAFGVVTLLGILPALMVWWGRYRLHLPQPTSYRAPGGKPALIAVIAISLAVITIEVLHKIGLLEQGLLG